MCSSDLMYDIDEAITNLETLRSRTNPVKTLMVAYGDGISTRGMNRFDRLGRLLLPTS